MGVVPKRAGSPLARVGQPMRSGGMSAVLAYFAVAWPDRASASRVKFWFIGALLLVARYNNSRK